MKKLRYKIFGFGLLLLLLFIGALLVPAPLASNNMLNAYADKSQRLAAIDGPKIILIGGSNTTFGINSEKVEEALGRQVVNMGLHAGLGLNFCMNDVLPEIGEGDLVIVSPEYQQFKGMFYGRSELLMLVCDVQPESKAALGTVDWWQLRNNMPSYMAAKYWRLLKELAIGSNDGESEVYNRKAFNVYGDVVAHHGRAAKQVQPRKLNELPVTAHIERLVDFRDSVNHREAIFLFSYPPYPTASFNRSKEFIDTFQGLMEAHFKEKELLGTAREYAFSDHLFFNSVYHLTEEGKQLRTEQLIKHVLESTLFP